MIKLTSEQKVKLMDGGYNTVNNDTYYKHLHFVDDIDIDIIINPAIGKDVPSRNIIINMCVMDDEETKVNGDFAEISIFTITDEIAFLESIGISTTNKMPVVEPCDVVVFNNGQIGFYLNETSYIYSCDNTLDCVYDDNYNDCISCIYRGITFEQWKGNVHNKNFGYKFADKCIWKM